MREHFSLKETNVWIIADKRKYIEIAIEEIKRRRKELERFIQNDPYFMVTMESYEMREGEGKMPEIAKRMIEAANRFGIGPMAAVAGAIAEFAVEAMRDAGAKYAIVDNGGDIALITDRNVLVGIYSGNSPFSNKIALKINPSQELIGICTSSGTVGHSISFGNANAATVIANSASLADAAATALCNAITDKSSIERAFDIVKHVDGVEGAIVIHKDILATWGKIPELVKINDKSRVKRRNSLEFWLS
ncbi:MAG: UPF0280 family protein [Candidatus Methanospirareceae archaeon]